MAEGDLTLLGPVYSDFNDAPTIEAIINLGNLPAVTDKVLAMPTKIGKQFIAGIVVREPAA